MLADPGMAETPKAEQDVVKRFIKTRMNAERQHRENVSRIVQSLFVKITEEALNHVKEETFSVENGDPSMCEDHPLLKKLLAPPAGNFSFLAHFD